MVNLWLLRLVSNVSHFKSFNIAVMLAVLSYLWRANRAAHRWTCSSVLQFCAVWLMMGPSSGSIFHCWAYKYGVTCSLKPSCNRSEHWRWRIWSCWPSYLSHRFANSRIAIHASSSQGGQLFGCYIPVQAHNHAMCSMGDLSVMRNNWHLDRLKDISQVLSQAASWSKSCWSWMEPAVE